MKLSQYPWYWRTTLGGMIWWLSSLLCMLWINTHQHHLVYWLSSCIYMTAYCTNTVYSVISTFFSKPRSFTTLNPFPINFKSLFNAHCPYAFFSGFDEILCNISWNRVCVLCNHHNLNSRLNIESKWLFNITRFSKNDLTVPNRKYQPKMIRTAFNIFNKAQITLCQYHTCH